MITVKEPFCYVEEIKKSIFTAWVSQVESVDEAIAFIESKNTKDATHNCWAYMVNGNYRFSDDGEPSSTAGKPIFHAIEFSEVENIAVIVSRHSSGIKLGAGGLVRAYGGTASKVIQNSEKIEIAQMEEISIFTPFSYTGKVYHIIGECQGEKISENFTDSGTEMLISIPSKNITTFRGALVENCFGDVVIVED